MDNESLMYFIIGLFLTVVGLIGTIFCSRFIIIEFSIGMLILQIVMIFIFFCGFLLSMFEILFELLDRFVKRFGG